ncbi:hypothetical protein B0T22DRAFT_475341 [Podospora appendiculata]|uniref:Uncharacterized protein n=1 Tax=Podospora appendiculata TaxID=314037 RepID=A0AAE0XFI2_9PEZI|nr:hypothetical protein B0T22DRAFT_475341 [Podospora appendiculata]
MCVGYDYDYDYDYDGSGGGGGDDGGLRSLFSGSAILFLSLPARVILMLRSGCALQTS